MPGEIEKSRMLRPLLLELKLVCLAILNHITITTYLPLAKISLVKKKTEPLTT